MEKPTEVLRHIAELDGVRGIAVLSVMVLHFYGPVQAALPFGAIDAVLRHGGAGVNIFFVLSGFLITSILVSTRLADNYFQAFYARRVLRIFPLYILFLVLFFWIALPLIHHLGKDTDTHFSGQLYYWLFLSNWRVALHIDNGAQIGHFWSLAVEEQFYVLWSLIVWAAPRRAMKYISVAVFVASFGLHLYGLAAGWSTSFLYFSTITRVDCLALGSLLAVSAEFREWLGKYSIAFLAIAIAGGILTTSERFDFLSHDLGAVSLVALALMQTTPMLRTQWLRTFGKYSYGLYVIHYPIAGFAFYTHQWSSPLIVGLTSILGGTALSFAIAKLSWKYVEEPILRCKGYFNYRYGARTSHGKPLPSLSELQPANS